MKIILFSMRFRVLYTLHRKAREFGGFDIFKSKFDSLKNEWSKPQQLSFPINSPWDDYLFLSDSSGATFVSNRDCKLGYVKVYHIEYPGQCQDIQYLKPDEKLQECYLKIPKKTNSKKNNWFEK